MAGTNVATLTARLEADTSGLKSGLARAERQVKGFGSRSGAAFKAVGVAAVAGAAVAGVAVAGLAAKGISEFAAFEKGMNEVFTLLPGISNEAMGKMEDDVLSLSQKMGVLPEETVPALYQALSAGVPQDNVFAFMETATKAAIGGATDLETAVDGLTSVVNAYGAENITAGEASDIMFTAVKDGKTTMEELSRSLFQVNPIASGLGVEFGDVAASLAALTAQGVPTSVASTQMRQAFVELSKEGGNTADIFEDVAGQSFKEFIAGGGNVQEAFTLMKDEADEMGVGVNDLFGSVEAGMAVMALTSDAGAESFTNALDDMASSTGATDAAFATMDQGLSRSWDRIKSTVSVALVKIGAKLAPFVEKAAEWLGEKLPGAIDWLIEAFEKIGPVVGRVVAWLGENIPKAVAFLVEAWETIAPIVTAVFDTVRSVIETVVGWFKGDATKDVEAGTSKIKKTFQAVYDFLKPLWDKIYRVVEKAIELIKAVTEKVVAGISAFWETHGDKILDTATTIFGAVRDFISGVMDVISGVIDTVMGIISGDWDLAWEGIKDVVSGVWDAIKSLVDLAIANVKLTIALALDGIKALWDLTWNAISTFVAARWEDIKTKVSDAAGWVRDTLAGIWDGIKTKVTEIWDGIKSKIGGVWDTISGWVEDKIGGVRDTLAGIWDTISGKVTTIWDGIKSKIGNVWDGIKGKVVGVAGAVRDALAGIWGSIKTKVTTIWDGIKSKIGGVFDTVKGWVEEKIGGMRDALAGIWDSISRTVSTVWGTIKDTILGFVNTIINGINTLIGAMNTVSVGVPDIPGIPPVGRVSGGGTRTGGGTLPSSGSGKINSGGVVRGALGGIVTSPTMALLGEAGPEAVVPLNRTPGSSPLPFDLSGVKVMSESDAERVLTAALLNLSREGVIVDVFV